MRPANRIQLTGKLRTCSLCGRLVVDDHFPKAVAEALFRVRLALDRIERDGADVREARARLWELAEASGSRRFPEKIGGYMMRVGYYRGRKFYYNEFWMEIYEELPDGKLRRKRDFHKWERLIRWEPEHNCLASEAINRMHGFEKNGG